MNIPEEIAKYPATWRVLCPPIVVSLICLIIYHYSNFLVFHTVVEFFSILVGCIVVTVAFTSIQFTNNQFVIVLAMGAGWCAGLDFIHLFVYKGMNVLPSQPLTESSQFWICARFLQALAFLISPFFLYKKAPIVIVNIGFGVLATFFTLSIFLGYFPVTFIEGYGVTTFKTLSELFIVMILLVAIYFYRHERRLMGKPLFYSLQAAMILMIFSEISFTNYIDLYDSRNIVGHLLKLFVSWFIYNALVITTLREPFRALALSASTYDTIPDPTIIIARDGVIFQANEAASRYNQLSTAEIVGLSSHLLFHNKLLSQDVCPVCMRLANQQRRFTSVLERGENEWMECSLTPINSHTHTNAWVQVIRDVSARKKLEIEKNRFLRKQNLHVRELSCLYRLATLLTSVSTIEHLLEEVTRILPTAFEFPEQIAVQIIGEWGTFGTISNPAAPHIQADLHVEGANKGSISIFNLDGQVISHNVFSKEDQSLLDSITKQLSEAIHRIIMLQSNKQLTYLYEMLSSANRAALHCRNNEELFASLFDVLLQHGAYDVLFIATHNESDGGFSLKHFHGIEVKDLSDLTASIANPAGSLGSLIPQLPQGKAIPISKNSWVIDEWTKVLQSMRLDNGFMIPLLCNKKTTAFIVAYSRSSFSTSLQHALLTEIGENASYALTGFMVNNQREIAEQKAEISEYRFSEVFMAAPLPMMIISQSDNTIISVNKEFENWFGYSMTEILTDEHWLSRFLGKSNLLEHNKRWLNNWQESRKNNKQDYHSEMIVYDSQDLPRITRLSSLSLGEEIVLTWVDLTDIRHNEELLRERELNFRRMIEQPFTGIYVRDEHHFIYMNPRFCEILGYPAEEIKDKALQDLVPDSLSKHLVLENFNILRESHSSRSYLLPFQRKNGQKIILGMHGTSMMWNGKPAVFGLVQDVTEAERSREQIHHYVKALQTAIKGTFNAVAKMVELRDPYTAGHERRVGLIAKEIAKEMGWPAARCDSLELIGLVHDIGKIAIPAEILVKPTALTPIEKKLLEVHTQAGYDILKDIEFDAPIAETILQHHERLDGSGYPRGLKGDQINSEARIIAVADVLESMSSHRPYRPALGIEVAIDELLEGRECKYDAQVVDTIVKLIREKGYQIPT